MLLLCGLGPGYSSSSTKATQRPVHDSRSTKRQGKRSRWSPADSRAGGCCRPGTWHGRYGQRSLDVHQLVLVGRETLDKRRAIHVLEDPVRLSGLPGHPVADDGVHPCLHPGAGIGWPALPQSTPIHLISFSLARPNEKVVEVHGGDVLAGGEKVDLAIEVGAQLVGMGEQLPVGRTYPNCTTRCRSHAESIAQEDEMGKKLTLIKSPQGYR
jgi:hypothetical protein